MKLANHAGRAVLVLDDGIADVANASDGRFGPDPDASTTTGTAFVDFAAARHRRRPVRSTRPTLGCPVPRPRQVFAIGLNYRSHAEESGHGRPRGAGHLHQVPGVARRAVRRHRDRRRRASTGRSSWSPSSAARADRVAEADAWSPRRRAHRRPGHQRPAAPVRRRRRSSPSASPARATARWGRGSSPPTRCRTPTTSPSVARSTARPCRTPARATSSSACPQLVAELSAVLPLLPGDVIFTGTPAGVGFSPHSRLASSSPATSSRRGSRASARSATGACEHPARRRRPPTCRTEDLSAGGHALDPVARACTHRVTTPATRRLKRFKTSCSAAPHISSQDP